MKTIAIFSGYTIPHLGGVEKYTDNLSKQLIKKGYRVVIISSNYNNENSYEESDNLVNIKIPIFKIFKNRYPIPKKNKEYKRLVKKLNNYKIDKIIVNTRFHLTSHIGAKYGKKHGISVYLIEHGSNYVTLDNKFIDFFANRYEDFLTWKIKRKVKEFYGVSKAANEWLKKYHIKAKGVWYNSIDTTQKVPLKKEHKDINFLYAGRLIKQKGVENVLDAFCNLEKKYNNIKLYIAGAGLELKKYKNKYDNEKIFFLGKLDYSKLLKYYAITDVFLYPPLWPEGLPTSILEAGLLKCAVIGTKQGGIVEILNSENGLLIDNDLDSLINAMELLINDRKIRNKIINNLYKDILNKFSWDVTSNKIIIDLKI